MASELVFILIDFVAQPASERSASGPAERAAMQLRLPPRLPALETVLGRARRAPLAPDWRAWLAARMDVPTRSPAVAVAAAWGQRAPGVHYWLATPVHLFAGLDSVHLHPAGLLQLDVGEQQMLIAEFAAVFADSPWRLHALGHRELLLTGPALYASAADPAGLAGADLSLGMARGQDAAALRRLGSEIELWLHEHPLNVERQRRGELPVTTLWLWGGALSPAASVAAHAEAPRAPPRRPLAHLYGCDSYADALGRLAGRPCEPLPAGLEVAASLLDANSDSVVLYPMSQNQGVSAALLQLEQRWLAAACTALRARRVRALQLLAGACVYRLCWFDLARVWRARAPWWEQLS